MNKEKILDIIWGAIALVVAFAAGTTVDDEPGFAFLGIALAGFMLGLLLEHCRRYR